MDDGLLVIIVVLCRDPVADARQVGGAFSLIGQPAGQFRRNLARGVHYAIGTAVHRGNAGKAAAGLMKVGAALCEPLIEAKLAQIHTDF